MGRSPHTLPPTTPALPTSARRTLTSSCRPTAKSPICRAQTGMCKRNYKRTTNVTPGIPDCCPDGFFSPRASCLGEVAPILTCFTPGALHLLSVAWKYPMALWSICLSPHLESAGFGNWSESDFLFFSIYCLCFWGFLCAFGNFSSSLSAFLAKSDEYVYKLADNLLDAMTNGEHSKSLKETEPVSVTS